MLGDWFTAKANSFVEKDTSICPLLAEIFSAIVVEKSLLTNFLSASLGSLKTSTHLLTEVLIVNFGCVICRKINI